MSICKLFRRNRPGLVIVPPIPPLNNPPVWDSQPSISFVFGVSSSYDMNDITSDPDSDAITFTMNTGAVSLPDGVTWTAGTGILAYDGVGAVDSTSGHVITLDDGTDTTASDAFGIGIALPGLVEGSVNVFVYPGTGSDSYDGLYSDFLGGTNGPKATWAGVAAMDLSAKEGIFFLAGTTITGEIVDVPDDFVGSSGDYNTIGAYYISGGNPLQGLGGGERPIIQGTATRPLDYDGTKNLTGAQHVPSFIEGSGNQNSPTGLVDLGLNPSGRPLRKATAIPRYVTVENLTARHCGGPAFKTDAGSFVTFTNCFADCSAGASFQIQSTTDCIVEDSFSTASGYGDLYYGHDVHPANNQTNQSDRIIYRRNLAWLHYGETFDAFATSTGANDNLWEDNVTFDTWRLLAYNSAGSRNVWRRNLLFQTNRVSVKAGHDFSGLQETFAGFSVQACEREEDEATKSVDCAFYNNIMIYHLAQFRLQDDWRANYGAGPDGAQHDFESLYIFRNTHIAAYFECTTDSGGGANPTASDGKWQYNLHMFPVDSAGTADNQHKVRFVSWTDADQKHNGWTDTQDADTSGWTNNIAVTSGDHTYDTTGWNDLQSLGTWDLHDGHGLSLANAQALVTAVKAKLGAPTNNAANVSADAVPGHPASVTIATFDDLDFNGDAYVNNDLGAIKA